MRKIRFALVMAALTFALGCSSSSAAEGACEVARRDCPGGGDSIDACVDGLLAVEASADVAGCGAEVDAMLGCYASTSHQCSGDNWPECDAEEIAWAECCATNGCE